MLKTNQPRKSIGPCFHTAILLKNPQGAFCPHKGWVCSLTAFFIYWHYLLTTADA